MANTSKSYRGKERQKSTVSEDVDSVPLLSRLPLEDAEADDSIRAGQDEEQKIYHQTSQEAPPPLEPPFEEGSKTVHTVPSISQAEDAAYEKMTVGQIYLINLCIYSTREPGSFFSTIRRSAHQLQLFFSLFSFFTFFFWHLRIGKWWTFYFFIYTDF